MNVLVDVPRDVCLPCLKTLQLRRVAYSNQDSIRLLLSCCPVLEDLFIERDRENDNVKAKVVVIVPSLQRLSLKTGDSCSDDEFVIVTPSLKYLSVDDCRESFSYLIEHMPELEEADIDVMQDIEKLLKSVSSAKRLTLRQLFNSKYEHEYHVGIVFSQLEQVKLCIREDYWSKLVIWLLKISPKLGVLDIDVDSDVYFHEYERDNWKIIQRSAPECLKSSLETLKFAGYNARPEERDFLSFIFKKARCLKTSSILHCPH